MKRTVRVQKQRVVRLMTAIFPQLMTVSVRAVSAVGSLYALIPCLKRKASSKMIQLCMKPTQSLAIACKYSRLGSSGCSAGSSRSMPLVMF